VLTIVEKNQSERPPKRSWWESRREIGSENGGGRWGHGVREKRKT